MIHINNNNTVAISGEWFSGHGKAFNLGHIKLEENKESADKLRKAFAAWYDNGHTNEDDINTFGHYGSKFLAGEVAQNIKINNFSYGAIKDDNDKICIVGAGSLDNMTNMIENQKCRWIDYVETGNSYTDPATGETPVAFRLAFK